MRHQGKRSCFVCTLTWIILLFLEINTQAGPVKRAGRTIREVYPEIEPEKDGSQAQVCIVGDVVYGMDEEVPAEQPCLKCRCQPPGVQCETTRCAKKPGCRAIHKPNKCCPDYQCECEHEGNIYANGERLETSPGGECRVCYCRGGEVQCAEVTCYIRTDCEGRTVPGQCCPKYDHCPPKEPLMERTLLTTEAQFPTNATQSFNVYRSTLESEYATSQSSGELALAENLDEANKIPDDKKVADKSTQTDFTDEPDLIPEVPDESPRVVVDDVIPEVRLVPVGNEESEHLIIEETTEAKNQVADHNTTGVALPQNINDLVITDSDLEPSEVSEIYHPPPVLRIGDKLLFLKKGELIPEKDISTPIPVITIIGAEGLQRGFEESGEVHEIPAIDVNEENGDNQSNDLEVSGSETTHILSLVKFRNRHRSEAMSSTVSTSEATTEITTETSTFADSNNTTETTELNTSNDYNSTDTSSLENITVEELATTEGVNDTSSQSTILPDTENKTITTTSAKLEEEAMIVEQNQNPAYPPIPDVMSPENIEMVEPEVEIKTDSIMVAAAAEVAKEETKILTDVLEIRNNNTIPQNVSNIEWLKNHSMINEMAALPDEILKQPAPSDFDEVTTLIQETTTMKPLTDQENLNTTQVDGLSEESKQIKTSVETIEENTSESSKEATTVKSHHPSLMSNENASVDLQKNSSPELSPASELVEIMPSLQESTEEAENKSEEIISEDGETKVTTTKPIPSDVEFIDQFKMKEGDKETLEAASEKETLKSVDDHHEIRPETTADETQSVKQLGKRHNSKEDEDKEVFRQLDDELKSSQTQRTLTKIEEDKEAENIFKELLEETTSTATPKPLSQEKSQPRNKESEVLQRVSDAIAKFQLRDSKQSLDTSILGILRDFFSSQYKD